MAGLEQSIQRKKREQMCQFRTPSDTAEFLNRLTGDWDRSFIKTSSQAPRIKWAHSTVDLLPCK